MDQSSKEVRKESFGFLINSVASRINRKMAEELKPHDLNLKQFGTLMMVFEMEGATQNEISNLIEMPGYATSRTLDKLESKELIYRVRPKENRRAHYIYLTDKGKKLKTILPSLVVKTNEFFLNMLANEEREVLLGVLHKLK